MSLTLDAYRAKVVIEILYARAIDDVERCIDTAIRVLENRKVNGLIIARFIDKIINQLERINLSETPERLNNMRVARSSLNRFKESFANPVG